MTRMPAIPARDEHLQPPVLRGIGLLAETTLDASAVRAAMGRIEADGWVLASDDPAVLGWMQRQTDFLRAVAASAFTMGWIDPTIPTERDGGGWMVIRIAPAVGRPGTSVDVRGELDAAMELALSTSLLALDARLVRRWDPTALGRHPRRTHRIPTEMRPRPRPRVRRS